MLLLSWFGVGSLYLSLVVIFTLAFNGLVPQATEQVLWTFALVYSFLTLLQVCVCVCATRFSALGYCTLLSNADQVLFSLQLHLRRVSKGICVRFPPLCPQLLLGLGSKPNDTIRISFICSFLSASS